MEVEVKVITVHLVAAIAAAYLAFILSNGSIPALDKNEAIAVLAGLVILYLAGQVSERLFGKEEVGGFKGWLWSGIVPFILIWFVVWAMFINLL
ncbi:MAG TPA: hypothetical protein VK444_05475 [Methanobacteriaceae archaeon]|nr:hypothetical protein [Methanobacteriaceae archaeon]